MAGEIPIVNFGNIGKESITNQPSEFLNRLSQDMFDAFSTVGFLYIKNHGIDEEKISNLFMVAKKFFQLPTEIKSRSARSMDGTNQGWVACGIESLDPTRPHDVKEAFNVDEPGNDSSPWPTVDCITFRKTVGDFFNACEELSLKILHLISLGLKLKDDTFLRRMHQNMSSGVNATALRLLYYPAIDGELSEGQRRCGEHSDYGTITLLFQDNVGGLEVRNREGQFVCARPIEGTVLVNIGDLLQRWTNNKLVSTRHRVGVPQDESLRSVVRQSAAFFVHPNDEALIECLDGSGAYAPITALEYLKQRFAATYI